MQMWSAALQDAWSGKPYSRERLTRSMLTLRRTDPWGDLSSVILLRIISGSFVTFQRIIGACSEFVREVGSMSFSREEVYLSFYSQVEEHCGVRFSFFRVILTAHLIPPEST